MERLIAGKIHRAVRHGFFHDTVTLEFGERGVFCRRENLSCTRRDSQKPRYISKKKRKAALPSFSNIGTLVIPKQITLPRYPDSCWQWGTIWSVTAVPFNGGTGQAPSGLHRLEDSQLWISPGKGCTYADCPGSVDPRVSRLPDHLAPGSDTGRWDAGVWAALWESWSMGQAALGIQHVGEANDPTCPERHSHPFGCTWIKKRLWFPCYLVWGKQYIKAWLISPRLSPFLLGFVLANWCFFSPASPGWTEGKIAKFKSEGWCFLQCGPIIFCLWGQSHIWRKYGTSLENHCSTAFGRILAYATVWKSLMNLIILLLFVVEQLKQILKPGWLEVSS